MHQKLHGILGRVFDMDIMKDDAELWAVRCAGENSYLMWTRSGAKQGLSLTSSRATSQLTLWTKASPATKHAGKFGSWWKCLPTSSERLWKSLQGLKMKFESRNKRSSKAESSHSCRLSLLLKRHHQNIPQPWTWKWGCTVKWTVRQQSYGRIKIQ